MQFIQKGIIKETGSISGGIEAIMSIHGHLDGKISAENVVITTGLLRDIEFSNNLRTENGADMRATSKKNNKSKITVVISYSLRQKKEDKEKNGKPENSKPIGMN